MKKDIPKKFQREKLNFKTTRAKTIVRAWGLAKRLNPSHVRSRQRNKK